MSIDFKVGDRVKVTNPDEENTELGLNGFIGEVFKLDAGYVFVQYLDGGSDFFVFSHHELTLEPAAPPVDKHDALLAELARTSCELKAANERIAKMRPFVEFLAQPRTFCSVSKEQKQAARALLAELDKEDA